MTVQGAVTQRRWVPTAASLALVGIGIFLVKICVLDVLEAAHRQEPVSVSLKGVLLAPALVVRGLAATGASFRSPSPSKASWMVNPATKKLSPAGYGVAMALLAAGGGLYLWLRFELSSLGYEF
jgi:hypothetical protein